jgi:hypothetical protein
LIITPIPTNNQTPADNQRLPMANHHQAFAAASYLFAAEGIFFSPKYNSAYAACQ